MIGEIINGKYKITSVFAESHVYELFTAIEGKTGATVIIKLLKEEMAASPERIKCFSEEISSFAKLSHPNVAEILDVDMYDGRPFVVTALAEGLELNEVIKTQALPFSSCCKIIKDLAQVLKYAFEQNIEYRNIKLSNVLLSDKGKIKVLSFTRPRLRLASSSAQSSHSGIHADLFFLGGTFFELLSGESIIRKRGGIHELWDMKLESQMRIRHQELSPDQISKTVFLIKKSLTRDMKLRFNSHDEFLKALSLIERFAKASTERAKPKELSMASQVVDAINGRGLNAATQGQSLEEVKVSLPENGIAAVATANNNRVVSLMAKRALNNKASLGFGQTEGNLALKPQNSESAAENQTKANSAAAFNKAKPAAKNNIIRLPRQAQKAKAPSYPLKRANNAQKAKLSLKSFIESGKGPVIAAGFVLAVMVCLILFW